MANLVVNGVIKEAGGRVLSSNYMPKLIVTAASYTTKETFTPASSYTASFTINLSSLNSNQAVGSVYAMAEPRDFYSPNNDIFVLSSYSVNRTAKTLTVTLDRGSVSLKTGEWYARISYTILTFSCQNPVDNSTPRLLVDGGLYNGWRWAGGGEILIREKRVRTRIASPSAKESSYITTFFVSDSSKVSFESTVNLSDILSTGEFITGIFGAGTLSDDDDYNNAKFFQLSRWYSSGGSLYVTFDREASGSTQGLRLIVSKVKLAFS